VNSGSLEKWLFKYPNACYASYYFENYLSGLHTPDEAVWALLFFSSFTPTAINYIYYMNDKNGSCPLATFGHIYYMNDMDRRCPGRARASFGKQRFFELETNISMYRVLFSLDLCASDFFEHACKRLVYDDKGDSIYWLHTTYGLNWLSTASHVVIQFLFRSVSGYEWTRRKGAQKILALPALSKVRSHWKFVDWLDTLSGRNWITSVHGLKWLMSDPVFVYRKRIYRSGVVYKKVTDVIFIRKLIEMERNICSYCLTNKIRIPFPLRDYQREDLPATRCARFVFELYGCSC